MKSARKWIRDLFGFSANEINGFLVLVPLMMAIVISEPAYRMWISHQERDYSADLSALDTMLAQWQTIGSGEKSQIVLTAFDPNTATEGELRGVGLSEQLSMRIAAYRRKGGVFRVKSDLTKIYGLDSTLYNQLYSYISLPATLTHASQADNRRSYPQQSRPKKNVKRSFDINTADTLLLKTIYGIGPKLAARIVKFRDRLGGFVGRNQLYEVYGLDSMVVNRLLEVSFIHEDFQPKKININTATEEKLSAHPYIQRNLARRIVSYRFQHGDFPEASDIKKLSALVNDDLDRLLPYIKVKD